jgi:hypothetical protein
MYNEQQYRENLIGNNINITALLRAGSLAWLNIRFASEGSWVRIPPSPPLQNARLRSF